MFRRFGYLAKVSSEWILILVGMIALIIPAVICVNRYYGTSTVYGTGDTIFNTFHAHGGPQVPHRKWHVECMDGEAVVGIGDVLDDFQKLVQVWCKFMFPNKPPTNGLYPYFPSCLMRNMTFDYHCYQAQDHEKSINTFVTAFTDNEFQFFTFRPGANGDTFQPYKCCKTPLGYYIDYNSCYYMPTRDQYGEYYDATSVMIVVCGTGHVVTGVSKKINAWSADFHIEWIQCCRLGIGVSPIYRPPQHSYSYNSYANSSYPNKPPASYAAQYQARSFEVPHSHPRGFIGKVGNAEEGESAQPPATLAPFQSMGGPMFSGSARATDNFDEDHTSVNM